MAKHSYNFVLDCSVAMAWCFEDESNINTEKVLEDLISANAIVPSIWSLEVANVLLLAKKNKRITELQATNFIYALSSLPITIDQSTSSRALHSISVVASQLNLTIYDAAYLELAIRMKIPLITLDKDLMKAAKTMYIPTSWKS